MGRSFLAGLVFSISCLFLTPVSAQETEAEWVPIQGGILLDDGTPICALVLANGQYMFSCDGEGAFDLGVPLDDDGRITFFAFADGFAPFSVINGPGNFPFNFYMRTADPDSPTISMSRAVECSGVDRVRISGEVESSDGEPLCAMILANGQHMFSCGDSLGYYDLTVAVDENGQVTMFGFADGFQPYTDTFVAPDCSMAVPYDPMLIADPNGPYAGIEGVQIAFDGAGSSSHPDGIIVAYDWAFGDGNTGTGVEPMHTYAAAGIYTVTLTVTDEAGTTDSATTTARISALTNQPIMNHPPDCSGAAPSISLLWPANHDFVLVEILGITDPDGDAISITIDSIFQNEAVDAKGSGNTAPDGRGVGTPAAEVRAERSGKGNGRMYHIGFYAEDGNGGTCSGEVTVGVLKNQGNGSITVDGDALYDSTVVP